MKNFENTKGNGGSRKKALLLLRFGAQKRPFLKYWIVRLKSERPLKSIQLSRCSEGDGWSVFQSDMK